MKDHEVNRETVAEITESRVIEEAVSCVNGTQPLQCQESSVGPSLSLSDGTGQSVNMSVDTEQCPAGDSQLSDDAEIVELTKNAEHLLTNHDGDSTTKKNTGEDEIMLDENVNPFKTNAKVGFSPPPGGDAVTCLDNSRLPIDLDDPFKCSTKMANSPPPSPVNVPSEGGENVEPLILSPVNNTTPLTEVISGDVADKSSDKGRNEKTSSESAK